MWLLKSAWNSGCGNDMDILLLGITVVSLVVAFVMSVTAAKLSREEKQRSTARVAALSLAASEPAVDLPLTAPAAKPLSRAPWSSPSISTPAPATVVAHTGRVAPVAPAPVALAAPVAPATHASGFLGAAEIQRDNGGRQKSLAFAAVVLFAVLSGGLVWVMSEPRGTSAAAMGPNSPLELVSLTHQRQDQKLAVSGLVRNPVAGQPVEKLSAVVFLFDRVGTFITSAKANVDFLKLGAGDESPFVVSLEAPATVARYRVSFRTDEGVVPHVDRRDAPPVTEGGQPVSVSVK
jgi:hypothetical protein